MSFLLLSKAKKEFVLSMGQSPRVDGRSCWVGLMISVGDTLLVLSILVAIRCEKEESG